MDTITTLCKECGRKMEQEYGTRLNKYCSKPCRSIAQSKRCKGQKFGTWEEMYGKEKADRMKKKHSLLKKGKKRGTYEEMYGEERAKEISKRRLDSFNRTHELRKPYGTITIDKDTECIKLLVDGKTVNKSLYVHRMEEKIGYPIPKGFCVHHIDTDRMNNNIDNLELLTHSEHRFKHPINYTDKVYQNMSKAQKGGNNPSAKKVEQIETGKIFGCMNDIHELVGKRGSTTMKRALTHAIKNNTLFGGYHYKLVER